ncbi:MAG: hypothetical protein IPK17_22405 [Chloroflexi bacterium]|uniref:hypothetical protein n=1 Tax=Candidatus Flexifilum breve TaxID=3140694 RepID=UPI003135C775|nr:hypothetical protein [Chloroflexota bacterium]
MILDEDASFPAVLFLIVALLLGAPLTAQDIVLTEFYAPFNGNLSAYYPAGFDRIFSHGDILI